LNNRHKEMKAPESTFMPNKISLELKNGKNVVVP
jgi:hypothetical protein